MTASPAPVMPLPVPGDLPVRTFRVRPAAAAGRNRIKVKTDTPHILFINPWIHDFAAYDFWSKPLGLLLLAGILRQHGLRVSYLDCLDRFHPKAPPTDPYARDGRGPYLKTRIEKPAGLDDVPRNYSRYGIRTEWFREDLQALARPDLVCVTSQMTYWYPGVRETISVVREVFGQTPVVLGGIYASLCPSHAERFGGADRVVAGPGESGLLEIIKEEIGFEIRPQFNPEVLDSYPYPAFDLQRKISYVPLLASRGCPFGCAYCASRLLQPKRLLRDPGAVAAEIEYWSGAYQVKDFVFYDDALLVDGEKLVVPLLEKLVRLNAGLRFHTPNAVHVREITKTKAQLMAAAGFKTLRLGLESAVFENRSRLDDKVTAAEFLQAVAYLRAAGFKRSQLGAYLLVGLPGQSIASVVASIRTVKQSGITPILAYYSPIPHTALWKSAVASSRYPLDQDPVFSNNAILPCLGNAFSWKTITYLKGRAAQGRVCI